MIKFQKGIIWRQTSGLSVRGLSRVLSVEESRQYFYYIDSKVSPDLWLVKFSGITVLWGRVQQKLCNLSQGQEISGGQKFFMANQLSNNSSATLKWMTQALITTTLVKSRNRAIYFSRLLRVLGRKEFLEIIQKSNCVQLDRTKRITWAWPGRNQIPFSYAEIYSWIYKEPFSPHKLMRDEEGKYVGNFLNSEAIFITRWRIMSWNMVFSRPSWQWAWLRA